MKVSIAVFLLLAVLLELSLAAHRNAYRISRSNNNRKKKESYDYNFDYDTGSQSQHDIGHELSGHELSGHEDTYGTEHIGKSGYSEGSGLRNIAQGSADQASSAVANQELAAKQASYIAQNNLANLALQASSTAMAALQGKQVLLAKIEQENLEAHQALESELAQLRQAKRSAKAAQQSAQQALQHLQLLQTALNNAQTAGEHAQQSASEASAELASQTNMVGKAKARVEKIGEQLHQARIDYEATVKAANDAQTSAQIAQNNAAEAAAKASLSTVHEVSSGSYGHGHGHLDAHESTKTLTVASPSSSPHSSSGSSSNSHERDSIVRSSSASGKSSSASGKSSSGQASSKEAIAANHNYGSSSDFKPSNGPQYSYAGY
ncbi:unnamed protein product [Chironomus riparius]|uniref:Uncharacterized protein n=1 Tax=Chironomus riparius TaxID=315576 RepID=A0A9N9S043_9DIPT|nr:unnamed protein product [Chironomus riparius]